MNDPEAYYDPTTNTYRFTDWCADHSISPFEVYSADANPAVDVAARMNNHNHDEYRWQESHVLPIVPRSRPRPFHMALFALLFVLAALVTLAPVVVLAAL